MGPMWSVFARCSAWVEETGESFCGESLKNMNSRRLTTRNRLWQSRGGFISLKIFSRGWKKVARLQGLGGLNTLESAALLVVIVTCWTQSSDHFRLDFNICKWNRILLTDLLTATQVYLELFKENSIQVSVALLKILLKATRNQVHLSPKGD
jgi:hypothetical protein